MVMEISKKQDMKTKGLEMPNSFFSNFCFGWEDMGIYMVLETGGPFS